MNPATKSVPMRCPCCDNDAWEARWRGFIVCKRCGVMTVEETFGVEQLKDLYQEDYFAGREYIDYVADKPAQQKTLREDLRLVQRFVPPGARLLEIGCAYGFFLELIKKEYPHSLGIDLCSAGVASAKARGLNAREGDLLEMQLEGQYDGVCMWDTIEHLPKPYEIVKRASELLKPGGHLFVTTGDFGALMPRLQGLKWRQIHPPTHLFYFTRDSLAHLARRVGLEPVKFGTVSVYRRFGSALQALSRFRSNTFAGKVATLGVRSLPQGVMNWSFPLNLGDTLYFVARKR